MIEAGGVTPESPRKAAGTLRRLRRPSLGYGEFLDRALEIFCEKGFDASMDTVAKAAGIAKRTIYARYGDKENLFKAALERAIDAWNVPVDRLRSAEADGLEESLQAIGGILVDNILTPAGIRLLRLTNSGSVQAPTVSAHSVRYGEGPVLAYLADLFRRKLPACWEGAVDAGDAAEVFLHLVVGDPGSAAAWGVVSDKAAIKRRTQFSIRMFLHGLLPISGEAVASCELNTLKTEMDELKAVLAEASQRLQRATAYLEAGN